MNIRLQSYNKNRNYGMLGLLFLGNRNDFDCIKAYFRTHFSWLACVLVGLVEKIAINCRYCLQK